jgi:hypothetical protein
MHTSTQPRRADFPHDVVPPMQQRMLRLAAAVGDWRAIDRITDELVRLGHCRPRADVQWQTRAELARSAARARGI